MRVSILLILLIGILAPAQEPAAADSSQPFSFVVMGCMPYYFPEDDARFLDLIDAVNAAAPAFTVHVGDTKSGQTPCSDEAFDQVAGYFERFNHPLVYSIGDNEWTDCHREQCGAYDPIERLAYLRNRFFADEHSLGAVPMPLVSQRRAPEYARFVENTRWARGGIVFAAVHVVGSNNNLRREDPAAVAEFQERNAANAVWIRETFAEAREENARAVALFIHANPFDNRGNARSDGFTDFVEQLRTETLAFGRPVVLFHADSHYFRIDMPLRGPAGATIEAFTRVETFGARNMHAVHVTVEPGNAADPFLVRPLIVEANRNVQAPATAAAD